MAGVFAFGQDIQDIYPPDGPLLSWSDIVHEGTTPAASGIAIRFARCSSSRSFTRPPLAMTIPLTTQMPIPSR